MAGHPMFDPGRTCIETPQHLVVVCAVVGTHEKTTLGGAQMSNKEKRR